VLYLWSLELESDLGRDSEPVCEAYLRLARADSSSEAATAHVPSRRLSLARFIASTRRRQLLRSVWHCAVTVSWQAYSSTSSGTSGSVR
jgi:hypothetical protein